MIGGDGADRVFNRLDLSPPPSRLGSCLRGGPETVSLNYKGQVYTDIPPGVCELMLDLITTQNDVHLDQSVRC